ncbi:GvpL/GvpF family gas vesicle protein [Saccharomonospora sp. NPDC046836]|uniref:GvpL/GvpF family gas vesicle protein n=1 Tax=Saccharomonospora sp. NPDC046836 TaxID=3156921 RepID=UPI0033F24DBB
MTAQPDTERQTACYVYGIVPADVESDSGARGIGDPPRPISVVRHGDIAALVSQIDVDTPLGRPEDLAAHARILDATAVEAPVLPLRFGAVVSDERAVAEELLAQHQDDFVAALGALEGRAEYVLKGRYEEQAILREVLAENEDAVHLREAIRDKPADATRNERIALGELITNVIAAKREADIRMAVGALRELDVTVAVREPTHERDAVHLACLTDVAKQPELERAAGALAERWKGRVEVRLLGPLAPYDFVTTQQPQG